MWISGMTENSFQASVFLCASATGHKLQPFVVFTGTSGGDSATKFNSAAYDHEFAVFTVQKNVYCDRTIMAAWIGKIWKPEVDGIKMLLLDSLRVRKMDEVRKKFEAECMTQIEFVPPGLTCLCQPLDLTAMANFKRRVRYPI